MTDSPKYVEVFMTKDYDAPWTLAKAPAWTQIGVGDLIAVEEYDKRCEVWKVAALAEDSPILEILEELAPLHTVRSAWKKAKAFTKETA